MCSVVVRGHEKMQMHFSALRLRLQSKQELTSFPPEPPELPAKLGILHFFLVLGIDRLFQGSSHFTQSKINYRISFNVSPQNVGRKKSQVAHNIWYFFASK